MQLRHSSDCLATRFVVVPTASTESFSSLRLGFLIVGLLHQLHREKWHSWQQDPVERCWMMLNDRKHLRTDLKMVNVFDAKSNSSRHVTKGECKLYILLGHHDNDWHLPSLPKTQWHMMTKRRYNDDTNDNKKQKGTTRHLCLNNCHNCSSVSLLLAWQWILPMSSWLPQMCFLYFALSAPETMRCIQRVPASNCWLCNKIDFCIVKDMDSAPKSYHVCLGCPSVLATHNWLNPCESRTMTSKKTNTWLHDLQ